MSNYTDERGNRVNERDTQKTVETTAVKAKQGRTGKPVLMVLVGGLVLAAVAWYAAEHYGEAIDNTAPAAETQAPSSNTDVTPSNQPVIDNSQPDGTPAQTAPALADPTKDTSTGGTTPPPAANAN